MISNYPLLQDANLSAFNVLGCYGWKFEALPHPDTLVLNNADPLSNGPWAMGDGRWAMGDGLFSLRGGKTANPRGRLTSDHH